MKIETLTDLQKITIETLDECNLNEVLVFAQGVKDYFEKRKAERFESLDRDIKGYEEAIVTTKSGMESVRAMSI